MVTQTHPEDKGAGYLEGNPAQHVFPGRYVVQISIQFVEVFHMHEAEGIGLLTEGELG
ncbi:hypothetical protein D3C72_2429600 [compost metagenome]